LTDFQLYLSTTNTTKHLACFLRYFSYDLFYEYYIISIVMSWHLLYIISLPVSCHDIFYTSFPLSCHDIFYTSLSCHYIHYYVMTSFIHWPWLCNIYCFWTASHTILNFYNHLNISLSFNSVYFFISLKVFYLVLYTYHWFFAVSVLTARTIFWLNAYEQSVLLLQNVIPKQSRFIPVYIL